jgi:hypothetical protein
MGMTGLGAVQSSFGHCAWTCTCTFVSYTAYLLSQRQRACLLDTSSLSADIASGHGERAVPEEKKADL